MKQAIKKFFGHNNLAVTIARNVLKAGIGYLIAYAPQLADGVHLSTSLKLVVMGIVMVVLTPIFNVLGGTTSAPAELTAADMTAELASPALVEGTKGVQ